ncbi:MAG: 5-formyltetrahydrofolate cyclo-ligase [Ponticaulis sp.]|nr:5-formyltetrahydrofolate cyclo-ligase [Ponticaulis sp.]|tara:strand:+ start:26106 stop:26699 length:594 start_codon:yes stop_codon:yes gene_type:complete
MKPVSKDQLRVSCKALREQLAANRPDAPAAMAERFPEKLLKRFGPLVAGYIAIGSEIDPASLFNRLRGLGAEICYPRVEADDSMTFRRVSSPDDLESGPFGLTQPTSSAQIVAPKLVLTPLLAFDAAGNRLGYGKGHYDRALARLRESSSVFVCGLAYSEQEVLQIPAEPTDIPLDWVVTENGSIPLFFSRVSGKNS